MSQPTMIQVLGPTGVGKSAVAVAVALAIGGEVISADSMQVYRDFNIGTGKLKPEEMAGVPHHLIDCLEDCSQFNAAKFLREAHACALDISARGAVPIVCGGTALYLSAMIRGIFPESAPRRVSRERLKRIGRRRGLDFLWRLLDAHDPEYARKVGHRDAVRIIRGLEIYYNQGLPPTEIFKKSVTPFAGCRFFRFGLYRDREELYCRIERRVDAMVQSGLIDEVSSLRGRYPPDCPPFSSLGYKEAGLFLDGKISLEEAVDLIKRNSRRFAKRQLSWFRQERDIHWFHADRIDGILEFLEGEKPW